MSKFKILYRQILKLHRLLPSEIKVLGDNYVKNEFKLHRQVKDPFLLETFYKEWSIYSDNILEQVSHDFKSNNAEKPLGSKLELKRLSEFNDDQLYNLMELRSIALNENEKTKLVEEYKNDKINSI